MMDQTFVVVLIFVQRFNSLNIVPRVSVLSLNLIRLNVIGISDFFICFSPSRFFNCLFFALIVLFVFSSSEPKADNKMC